MWSALIKIQSECKFCTLQTIIKERRHIYQEKQKHRVGSKG